MIIHYTCVRKIIGIFYQYYGIVLTFLDGSQRDFTEID
jgi:hypothetical protein